MKKILLASLLTMNALVGLSYAQKDTTGTISPEIKAEIEKLLSKAESEINNPQRLNKTIRTLGDNPYSHPLHNADSETKRSTVRRLIKIYNAIDTVSVNEANKIRIIDLLGSKNVPEQHEFFLSVLDNGPEVCRKEVLRMLYFYGSGDDYYDKVENLVARGVIKKEDSFTALKGANPKRAVKEIQAFIAETKNPMDYVQIGGLLSEYGDPNLMDVVLERYDYFKNVPGVVRPHRYDPTFAFDIDVLKKYISVKEGGRLKKALEIFDDSGVFGDSKLPLLKNKIESKDATSREAAIDFLAHQMEKGSIAKEKALPILKEAQSKETNQDLKRRLKRAIEKSESPAARGRK